MRNVVNKLALQRVSFTRSVIQLLAFFMLCIAGLGSLTILPTLYQITFRHVKNYLEQQAQPATLIINVHEPIAYIPYITGILVTLGVVVCFIINTARFSQFFIRISALLWALNIRLLVLQCTLFAIATVSLGGYFGRQLLEITKSAPASTDATAAQPLKLIAQLTAYPLAKKVLQQAQTLTKARVIFNAINTVSYYMFIIVNVMSILVAAWMALTLQEKMREIQRGPH